MPQIKGSYYGKTMTPQYQTYPTAGLLKPTPLPSVTPVPTPTKPSNEGGWAGTSPVNPQGPVVGPSAPSVPAINTPYDYGNTQQQQPSVEATPRQKLATAIMNRAVIEQ